MSNSLSDTHWHYPYLYADKRGLYLSACGIRVSKNEIDLQEPSCKICMNAMNNHDALQVDDDNKGWHSDD